MSRSPKRNDFFPPITSTYEDSYGSPRANSGQLIHYHKISNGSNNDKIGEFQFRLDLQERTTQQLVDRAVQIKQDLLENLSFTQGTLLQEKEARELLQEHIRTITAVIRQMNKDMKEIDSHLKEKENAIAGTGSIIRQIENNQVSSIGEIRSRIGRCDSISAKLANDIRLLGESIKTIGSELHQTNDKINEKIQTIELKSHDITNKVDRFNSESNVNIRISVDETIRQLSELDNRTKLALDDVRHQIANFNLHNQAERDKIENRIMTSLDKSFLSHESRIVKLEDMMYLDQHYKIVLERLENLEKDYKNFRRDRLTFETDMEKRMTTHSDRLYRQQIDDLSRFKREVRDSFAAIYETVSVMQSMVEKRQKLCEDNLRKEMGQIRKTVALI